MNKRTRALFTLNPPPFRRSIDLIENRSCDRVVVVVVVAVSRATKPPRAGCVSSSLVDETRARRVNLKKKRQSNQSNRGGEKSVRDPSIPFHASGFPSGFPSSGSRSRARVPAPPPPRSPQSRRRRTYVTTLARLAEPATRRSALSSIAAGARAARMPAGFCTGRPNAADAAVGLRDRTEDVVAPSVILVVVAALNMPCVRLKVSLRRAPRASTIRRARAHRINTQTEFITVHR